MVLHKLKQTCLPYTACTRGLVQVMYTRVACATVQLAFHLLHPFKPSTYTHLFPVYTHTPSLPYAPPTPNSIYDATFFITVLCSHISHPVLSHTHTHTHLLFTVTRAFSLPFTLGHLLDTRVHHFHTLPRN